MKTKRKTKKRNQIPSSFIRGMEDIKAGRVVDMDEVMRRVSPKWTYNPYRATLYKDGKAFALLSQINPNGYPISTEDQIILLHYLNRP